MPAPTLAIGCRFYLQYFKSSKTTYMTQFFAVSIDYSLLNHLSATIIRFGYSYKTILLLSL